MFKKSISLILALAFVLSTIVIDLTINTKTVEAATVTDSMLSFDFASGLGENFANGMPQDVTKDNNPEGVLLSFPMDKDFQGNPLGQDDKYVLSYAIADNKTLKVTVLYTDYNKVMVTYALYDKNGAVINYTTTGANNKFSIFDYINNGSYVTQGNFKANGTIATGYYVVTPSLNVPGLDPTDSPAFHINQGEGFSFKYDDATISFKWTTGGKFQIYSDAFKYGNIYDIALNYYDSDGFTEAVDTKKIFTGFSLDNNGYGGNGVIGTGDTFMAAPFANNHKFVNTVINSTTEEPGLDVNGIRFGFTYPKIWDATSYKYTTNGSSSNNMDMYMSLGGKQIKLVNNAGTWTVENNGGLKVSAIDYSEIDGLSDQFYFQIEGLPAGTVYENVMIDYALENVKTQREQYLKYGTAFTFPKYDVVQLNSKYYVKLDPFVTNNNGVAGTVQGSYLLTSGATGGVPSVVLDSGGKSTIYFPLPINSTTPVGTEYVYQIYFNPLFTFTTLNGLSYNEYIHSQSYRFIVKQQVGDISLPENFTVDSYGLSAISGIDKKVEMKLSLEMSYDVATEDALELLFDSTTSSAGINIKYALSNYIEPKTNSILNPYTYVNLHIYKGDYTADNGVVTNNTYLVDYDFYYDESMTSPPFKSIKGELLQSKYRADADATMYYANFLFDVRAERLGSTAEIKPDAPIHFQYPNIYFLTVNAVAIDRDGDGSGYEYLTGGSTFESITLNDFTDKEVPPPQSLAITNTTKKSFELGWKLSGTGLRDYLLEIFTTEELRDIKNKIGKDKNGENNLDAYYNIYIGTSESYMKNTYSALPITTTDGTASRTSRSFVIDGQEITSSSSQDPFSVFMSEYESEDGTFSATEGTGSTATPIDTLRATNGVVMISHFPIFNETLADSTYDVDTYDTLQDIFNNKSNIDNILSIYGLDKNTKYYIYADLVVETHTDDVIISTPSKLSPLVGETTLSDIDKPTDNDKIPASPTLTVDDTSVDNVNLAWVPIYISNSTGVRTYMDYEIIRLDSVQMDEKYLTTKDSFGTTWKDYLPTNVTDKAGFKTLKDKTPNIQKYNGTDFVATDDAKIDMSEVLFSDNGLTPNRVYFYYVRSVYTTVTDGLETKVYSNWSRVSATTKNIQSPSNLKINTIYDSYDPETEVVLNFDAPILDATKIGVAYDLYYSVRIDGGNWSDPILMNADSLRAGVVTSDEDSTNFNYKISNLKKGTSYTFKVKMVDKTTGASSMYSNEARAKTDMDQGEYDDDVTVDNWNKFIIEKLQEMLNEIYWTLNESKGQRDIVYREEKFPGFIASTTDSFVTLAAAKDNIINNYYISAASYQALCDSNKGLKIVYENVEYYLTPKALQSALTSAKKDVTNGNTNDYYIKLSVSGYGSGAINGQATLSDIMTFSIVAQGFETKIKAFEKESYEEMLELIKENTEVNELMEDITEYVEDGKSDLLIQKLVYDALPDIYKELISDIYDNFKDYLAATKYTYTVSKTDGVITVSLMKVDATTNASGYYRVNNNWLLKDTLIYGTMRTFSTYDTGVFVFTGSTLYLPGLEGLPYADTIKDLFVRYGLDKYLGTGTTFNTSNKLTGNMIMGSVARVMGMDTLSDPVTYLKDKNITASERVSKNNVKAGDMIYYLMKAYEYKTGSSIDNLNITNYQATANMTGLTTQNTKPIQVATQLGLITDSKFNASSEMTVKDFLFYLNRLNEIIKL